MSTQHADPQIPPKSSLRNQIPTAISSHPALLSKRNSSSPLQPPLSTEFLQKFLSSTTHQKISSLPEEAGQKGAVGSTQDLKDEDRLNLIKNEKPVPSLVTSRRDEIGCLGIDQKSESDTKTRQQISQKGLEKDNFEIDKGRQEYKNKTTYLQVNAEKNQHFKLKRTDPNLEINEIISPVQNKVNLSNQQATQKINHTNDAKCHQLSTQKTQTSAKPIFQILRKPTTPRLVGKRDHSNMTKHHDLSTRASHSRPNPHAPQFRKPKIPTPSNNPKSFSFYLNYKNQNRATINQVIQVIDQSFIQNTSLALTQPEGFLDMKIKIFDNDDPYHSINQCLKKFELKDVDISYSKTHKPLALGERMRQLRDLMDEMILRQIAYDQTITEISNRILHKRMQLGRVCKAYSGLAKEEDRIGRMVQRREGFMAQVKKGDFDELSFADVEKTYGFIGKKNKQFKSRKPRIKKIKSREEKAIEMGQILDNQLIKIQDKEFCKKLNAQLKSERQAAQNLEIKIDKIKNQNKVLLDHKILTPKINLVSNSQKDSRSPNQDSIKTKVLALSDTNPGISASFKPH